MDKKGTKQRILDEALSLFAVHGYDGVTVAQIADAVNIKTPSLYKHYGSKRDIFDAILTEMESRYKQQAGSLQMDGADPEKDTGVLLNSSREQLIDMGTKLFLYFLHDDVAQKFRRMLTIEQYKTPQLQNCMWSNILTARSYIKARYFNISWSKTSCLTWTPKPLRCIFMRPCS